MLVAPVLVALALVASPGPASPPDPCRAAAAPLSRPSDFPRDVFRAVETYRSAWRRACDPKASPDVAALLGDAEALALDARASRSVRALAAAALQRRAEWPLPGMRWVDGELEVEWAAFPPLAARGKVEDVRFWRAAAVAADGHGDPAWAEDVPDAPGAECIRLGQAPWAEVARALSEMEATEAAQYASHARELRERLEQTLDAIALGRTVCGCVRGDATAGLAALATLGPAERRNPVAQRVAKSAAAALDALRTGRARVEWLRQSPGGEPTGCRGVP